MKLINLNKRYIYDDDDDEYIHTTSAKTISSSLKKFSLRRSYSAAV